LRWHRGLRGHQHRRETDVAMGRLDTKSAVTSGVPPGTGNLGVIHFGVLGFGVVTRPQLLVCRRWPIKSLA
jgi:hypothetical protein